MSPTDSGSGEGKRFVYDSAASFGPHPVQSRSSWGNLSRGLTFLPATLSAVGDT